MLEPSTLHGILGVPNEGDAVPDTNTWAILSHFDPQDSLKCLTKLLAPQTPYQTFDSHCQAPITICAT